MKRIHRPVISLLVLCLSLMLTPSPALATDWISSFVVWDDSIYVVTDENVDAVGERIGEVTSFSDMEQRGGNFSNTFPKGTAYFEIPGTSSSEAIAVQTGEGVYARAEWESSYDYAQPVRNIGYWLLGGFAFLAIASVVYSMTRKAANK